MSKILCKIVLVLFLSFTFLIPLAGTAKAETGGPSCRSLGITLTPDKADGIYGIGQPITITVSFDERAAAFVNRPTWAYEVKFKSKQNMPISPILGTTDFFWGDKIPIVKGGISSVKVTKKDGFQNSLTFATILVTYQPPLQGTQLGICNGPDIQIAPTGYPLTSCSLSLPQNIQYHTSYSVPDIKLEPPNDFYIGGPGNPQHVYYSAFLGKGNIPASTFKLGVGDGNWGKGPNSQPISDVDIVLGPQYTTWAINPTGIDPKNPKYTIPDYLDIGYYTLVVMVEYPASLDETLNRFRKFSYLFGCSVTPFTVSNYETSSPLPSSQRSKAGQPCDTAAGRPCAIAGGPDVPGCTSGTGTAGNPGIATAIGCIHTNPNELVKDLLTFIIGIGGGLAFLMMLLGAYQMLSSGGNPETLNAGKERLTSAVIGLLFVIFSILLLQIIGVGILAIPGFK